MAPSNPAPPIPCTASPWPCLARSVGPWLIRFHLYTGHSLQALAAGTWISLRTAYKSLAQYRSGGDASLAVRQRSGRSPLLGLSVGNRATAFVALIQSHHTESSPNTSARMPVKSSGIRRGLASDDQASAVAIATQSAGGPPKGQPMAHPVREAFVRGRSALPLAGARQGGRWVVGHGPTGVSASADPARSGPWAARAGGGQGGLRSGGLDLQQRPLRPRPAAGQRRAVVPVLASTVGAASPAPDSARADQLEPLLSHSRLRNLGLPLAESR